MAKKGRVMARLIREARRERLAMLRNQLEEVGVMVDGFMKANPVMNRLVRDQFAAYAIACAAWGASDANHDPKKLAKAAYDLADAMMAERKKRNK